MAAVALLTHHGIVGAGLEKLPLGRRVRIMTVRAGGVFHGIVTVRLLETPFPGFVAGKAKRRLCTGEQVGVFRPVGEVAAAAPFLLEYGMDDLPLERFFRMALVARLRAFRLEEMASIRSVRVVAGGAVSLPERRMDIWKGKTDRLLAVTDQAQIGPLFLQEDLRNDPVTQVAFLALSLLHQTVHGFPLEVFLREILVAIEAALLLESPLLRPG